MKFFGSLLSIAAAATTVAAHCTSLRPRPFYHAHRFIRPLHVVDIGFHHYPRIPVCAVKHQLQFSCEYGSRQKQSGLTNEIRPSDHGRHLARLPVQRRRSRHGSFHPNADSGGWFNGKFHRRQLANCPLIHDDNRLDGHLTNLSSIRVLSTVRTPSARPPLSH